MTAADVDPDNIAHILTRHPPLHELEAVAVAADALDGAGDPAALVVALVAELARRGRLSEREVAVVLAGLIEGHPVGTRMVRVLTTDGSRPELRGISDYRRLAVVAVRSGRWLVGKMSWDDRKYTYPTQEAAEAALIAAQPEPRAVARVTR